MTLRERFPILIPIQSLIENFIFLFSGRDLEYKKFLKELNSILNEPTIKSVFNEAVKRYMDIPGCIHEKSNKLLVSTEYPAVKIVPRYLVVLVAKERIIKKLNQMSVFSTFTNRKKHLTTYFDEFISELDKASIKLKATPGCPLPSYHETNIVGIDTRYIWKKDNLPGHYFVREKVFHPINQDDICTTLNGIYDLQVHLGSLNSDKMKERVAQIEKSLHLTANSQKRVLKYRGSVSLPPRTPYRKKQ